MASADPLADSVLLWTRTTRPSALRWLVAADADLQTVVATGKAEARPQADQTVHVEVGGLDPATTYWYRFERDEEQSPVGRTRTAASPGPAAPGARLRLGVVSCSSYRSGYFNAYRHLARRQLDLVVHLGDYIYEGGPYSGRSGRAVRRVDPFRTASTLDHYRARHRQYRTDPDLLALHGLHPVCAIWDDHDIAGSAWTGGASGHFSRWHGDWPSRLAAATQAWREWVPLRSASGGDRREIFRTVPLGGLGDLFLLDTRLAGRDRPAAEGKRPVAFVAHGDRSLLGERQWRWLESGLATSEAAWKIVANQVVMAPIAAVGLGPGFGRNPDQWDGYRAERQRLLGGAGQRGDQMVVLSGDLHSSWANELGAAVEFVTPAVSAAPFSRLLLPPGRGIAEAAAWWLRRQNPHIRFCDLKRRGYMVLDVTAERVQADWWHLDTVARPGGRETWAGGWTVAAGEKRLVAAVAPSD